jgi:hypothetical protein
MTQAMRVALWVPTQVPTEVGDGVVTTNPPDGNKAITTKFLLGGGGGGGGGVPEAPSDGVTYGRKNTQWVPVGTGTVSDAPADGTPYARQDGGWVSLAIIDAGSF